MPDDDPDTPASVNEGRDQTHREMLEHDLQRALAAVARGMRLLAVRELALTKSALGGVKVTQGPMRKPYATIGIDDVVTSSDPLEGSDPHPIDEVIADHDSKRQ